MTSNFLFEVVICEYFKFAVCHICKKCVMSQVLALLCGEIPIMLNRQSSQPF
jgi:hypothetical protein